MASAVRLCLRALMKMQNEKMIEVGKKYIKILDREQLEEFGN